ncbi:MAG: glycoside hydrolase family 88 protein [Clostridia bacterium]
MNFEEKDLLWAKEVFAKIDTKMEKTIERTMGTIPYFSVDGKFNDMTKTNVGFWTNGFYAATLWILYHQTKNEKYRIAAEDQEKSLDPAFNNYFKLHHDVGFLRQLTSVLNYKLTGNEESRVKGMYAASLLTSRFNIDGKYIRAWQHRQHMEDTDEGWAIIDTMMNLSVLYWASEQVEDPRFARIAKAHADQTVKHHIREDGSVKHIVSYDPNTGEEIENFAGQGYSVDSSWTRGQGWAIYGLMNSYYHTQDKKYLEACKRVSNYFIAEIAKDDWLPVCDFRAPKYPEIWDSSAGGLAACGFLELAKVLGEIDGRCYKEAAIKILRAMEEKFCDWNPETDGMVHYGTVRYHANENESDPHNRYIVYSDFYFTEAITKILGTDLQIW